MKIKKLLIDVGIMALASGVLLLGTWYYKKHPGLFAHQGQEAAYADSSHVLKVWYTNERLTDFLTQAVGEYTEKSQISVEIQCVDTGEYLEHINQANMKGEGQPDIFLMESSIMEEAVLSGLAVENTDDSYSKKNYYGTALKACGYQGKVYGYPLCFNTAFLVYNKDYVTAIPTTFEDIKLLANQFQGDEKIQYMMEWDVKDLLYNYGIVGSSITYMEEADENGKFVKVDEQVLKVSLKLYQELSQYFSINPDTITYQKVCEDFLNQKAIFIIAGTDFLKDLKSSNVSYGILAYPNVSNEIPSRSLSITELIMVNPYTKAEKSATDLAKFLTYDKAQSVGQHSDYVSARILAKDEDIKKVGEIYSSSTNMPGLMATSGYWLDLRLALNQSWKGADFETVCEILKK